MSLFANIKAHAINKVNIIRNNALLFIVVVCAYMFHLLVICSSTEIVKIAIEYTQEYHGMSYAMNQIILIAVAIGAIYSLRTVYARILNYMEYCYDKCH
jgi:hypothetical protein